MQTASSLLVIAGLTCLCVPVFAEEASLALADKLTPESATLYEDSIRPVLVKFCGDCHQPEGKHDSFAFLKAATAADVATGRSLWKSVAEQLRNRTMPPADDPQPSEIDRMRVADWIEETMRRTACNTGEFAGAVTSRRLNRVEYDNTMRDLLGVNLELSLNFPVDGSGGEGFNNNGETLFLPPILMERYLEAASLALNTAILNKPLDIRLPAAALEPAIKDSKPAGSRTISGKDEVTAVVTIYIDGDYTVDTTLARTTDQPATAVISLGGIVADQIKLTEGEIGKTTTQKSTLHLTRGVHAIAVRAEGDLPVAVHEVRVREQRSKPSPQQTANHVRLFGVSPGDTPAEPRVAAEKAIRSFARQAFRRPVQDAEVTRLLSLYDRASERGDPFDECLKLAFKAILVSPHFLFRIEAEPKSPQPQLISDHELAVRLSYYLWSTMPDEELTRLADAGQLRDRAVLLAQTERMLNDPRSEQFAEQFVGQWLGTHEVGERVAPEAQVFEGHFNADMLIDFRDEPMYFFAHLLKENCSLLELIDADYTILNRRLKEHYGYLERKAPLEKTRSTPQRGTGGKFELFMLPDGKRGGVMGMAGVLLLTSYPDRTSPVLRGAWVLETMLGVKVPSPPPDVPVLKRNSKTKASVREQLAAHRKQAACAACHNLMDPIGFALENFDVLGRWRETDHEVKIDASATLPSGEAFVGAEGLRQVLLERKVDFIRHFTRKMLGFAIGRSLSDGDDCTIQKIVDHIQAKDYKVRELVHEVVLSVPFRMSQLAAEHPAHK